MKTELQVDQQTVTVEYRDPSIADLTEAMEEPNALLQNLKTVQAFIVSVDGIRIDRIGINYAGKVLEALTFFLNSETEN